MDRDKLKRLLLGGGLVLAAVLWGCGEPRGGVVPVPRQASGPLEPALTEPGPVDEPGQLQYDTPRPSRLTPPEPDETPEPGNPPAPREPENPGPSEAAESGEISEAPAWAEPARYMTIGSVLVEVGGAPIYADQVVHQIRDVLAAEARQRDPESFRKFAAAEIRKQVEVEIRNEVYFAEAIKHLTPQEQQRAEELATMYRMQLVTAAGGAQEVARARARQQGVELEEKVRERYRELMFALYRHKRVLPRVAVSPQDMRRYYERHIDREFTQPEQLHFSVIRVDVARVGSREEARAKIERFRARVLAGEDFATIARDYSDDFSARAGGDVGWIDRGAYAAEKVENAVAQLRPGEVSEVIEERDSFYIARLESHRPRQVKPFSDETVQRTIHETLRAQQEEAMTRRAVERLLRDAIINPEDYSIDPALELAMQRYWQWRDESRIADW